MREIAIEWLELIELSGHHVWLNAEMQMQWLQVIRGGILSVPRGQWEAFRSLGLPERKGLIRIILPQALPAIIPGLTSQYLNLAKNSTLAIAVGYSDIYAIKGKDGMRNDNSL